MFTSNKIWIKIGNTVCYLRAILQKASLESGLNGFLVGPNPRNKVGIKTMFPEFTVPPRKVSQMKPNSSGRRRWVTTSRLR
jgi:hypothetical protein